MKQITFKMILSYTDLSKLDMVVRVCFRIECISIFNCRMFAKPNNTLSKGSHVHILCILNLWWSQYAMRIVCQFLYSTCFCYAFTCERENITKRRARSLSTNTFAFNILLFYVSFLDKRKKTMIVV